MTAPSGDGQRRDDALDLDGRDVGRRVVDGRLRSSAQGDRRRGQPWQLPCIRSRTTPSSSPSSSTSPPCARGAEGRTWSRAWSTRGLEVVGVEPVEQEQARDQVVARERLEDRCGRRRRPPRRGPGASPGRRRGSSSTAWTISRACAWAAGSARAARAPAISARSGRSRRGISLSFVAECSTRRSRSAQTPRRWTPNMGECLTSSTLPSPRYMWTPQGRHGSKLRTARMMSIPLNLSGPFSSKIGVFCTASS